MISKIVSTFQIFAIFIWTCVCATTTFVILLFTWNRDLALRIVPNKMWAPFIFGLCGIKTKVSGLENIDHKTYHVFVANHQSHMDVPATVKLVPVPLYFLLKKELKKIPFFGWYATSIGMIYVDRKNKSKAQQSLKDAAELIKNGKNVLVYPEGTRSKDGNIHRFKRGAFIIAKESNIGIIPMAIYGSRKILQSGSFDITPGMIEMKIGEEILPETVEKLSLKELIQHTEDKVKELYVSIEKSNR